MFAVCINCRFTWFWSAPVTTVKAVNQGNRKPRDPDSSKVFIEIASVVSEKVNVWAFHYFQSYWIQKTSIVPTATVHYVLQRHPKQPGNEIQLTRPPLAYPTTISWIIKCCNDNLAGCRVSIWVVKWQATNCSDWSVLEARGAAYLARLITRHT